MIVYNETIIIEETLQPEWLTWMQQEQIPAIMATGSFGSYQILTVLDSPNEGVTYCIQYKANSLANFKEYELQHMQHFQSLHHDKFENRYVMFNTVMEEVSGA